MKRFLLIINAAIFLAAVIVIHQPKQSSVYVAAEAPMSKVALHTIPDRITIPDLEIDLPVKKAKIVNGYWEVFDDQAGWGDESGYPGEAGNQVIFAHARKGMFLSLRQVKKDTVIHIFAGAREFSYKVVDYKEVLPNDISLIQKTSDETLTLFTCSGFADTKRMVVTAKPN
jgi:LPXTG-site transpeptidase (sortase) family protein